MGKNLKCNLSLERQEEVFRYFDGDYGFCLDLAEETQMKTMMPQYLFYDSSWTGNDIRECLCTSCGGFTFYRSADIADFFKQHHGDTTECPNCGNEVKLIALGRMRSFRTINDSDERRFSIFRPAPDGGLLVISGWGHRQFTWNELNPEITFREKERAYFAPGERMRWKRSFEYEGLCNTGYAHPVGWKPCGFMGEPHNPTVNLTSEGDYYVICAERIEDTKLKYCRLEDWYYARCKVWLSDTMEICRFVHKFLMYYTEYPNMEMACRLGYWNVIDDLVDHGRRNVGILDWSAKTSWGFLRLSKPDGKQFLRSDGSLEDLKMLHEARKWDKGLSLAKFWDLIETCGNDDRTALLVTHAAKLARVSPQAIIHYATSHARAAKRKSFLQMLCDYLDCAKFLKYDLRQRDVALPKDLEARHNAATAASLILRQQNADKKVRVRVERAAEMYAFFYCGYAIVVPASVEEIIQEGKRLHHCVGGYADRHFNGALEILFLRKASAINKPFITLELAHRDQPRSKVIIRQMYGDHNTSVQREFKWFIDVWAAWLRAGSPRDAKGNPIIPIAEEVSA